MPASRKLGLALAAAVVAVAAAAPPAQPPWTDLPPVDRESLADWRCRPHREPVAQVRRDPASDGTLLSYRQAPAVLSAVHQGPVALTEVIVAGDVPEIVFRRYQPGGEDPVEMWRRVRTATVGARLVSVFEASWPEEIFADVLAVSSVGADYPLLYWGAILRPGSDTGSSVYLRVASSGLPTSDVMKIDDTAQFASHVANIVLPGFGTARAEGGSDEVDVLAAARKFYEHFADDYEVLTFAAEPVLVLDYDAWHRTVQNRVAGIGEPQTDWSRSYGSSGALHGVEVFRDARALTPRVALHEMTHQWGHGFDWGRLAGLVRQWPDTVHTPILSPGHSLIGAKLYPTWHVNRTGTGEFALARTPAPIEQGPLELYAMGLLAAEDLPELDVFLDQEQFAEQRTPLQPGEHLLGEVRRVVPGDLLGVHGRREGPRPSLWRRALVVVSRDGLLSQREMDYWNYHSARLEDPNRASPRSYEGYVSMDRATRYAVDLATRITPKALPAIGQGFDVDFPPFARDDCRAVRFAAPMATRHRVGERIRLGGTVTARDRSDFSTVLVRFWPYGGAASKVVREDTEISRGGDFQLEVEFREGQEGQFLFELFLFWPDSGAQYSRCTLSPVTVEPTANASAPRPVR